MIEPPVNARGPIRGLLDEFARMPEGRRTFVAGVISLALHALLLLGGGLLIFRLQSSHINPEKKTLALEKKKSQLEVILLTPTPPPPKLAAATPVPTPKPEKLTPQEDKLLEEKFKSLPPEIQREYADVDGLALKKNLSKRALLESWTDSVAGSRLPGKGEGPLPNQEGRELPFTNFKDQQAALGKEKSPPDAVTPEKENPLPTTPADLRPIFQPQPIAKEDLAPTAKNKPIPKVSEVAKVRPKEDTFMATPAPSRLVLASAATPPPAIRKVREASVDEIPMFINHPEQKIIPDVNLRPEPPPEPAPPKPTPTPAPTPPPTPTPEPLKIKPTPATTPAPVPKEPVREAKSIIVAVRLPNQTQPQAVRNPAYAPHQVQTQIEGGSAPPGENGVDAVATVSGKYKKSLNSTVGSRWTYFVTDPKFSSVISAGQTTVQFVLDPRGKIIRVKVTDNTSNPAHAQLCERAFYESQRDIDPPPPGVLKNGVYEDSFTFILY